MDQLERIRYTARPAVVGWFSSPLALMRRLVLRIGSTPEGGVF